MRIFVTGATGLVGSHMVMAACQRGFEVSAMVREPSPLTRRLEDLGATLVFADLSRLDEHFGAQLEIMDAVIHCAAKVGDQGIDQAYFEVNVEGTKRLFSHVSSQTRSILISTLGVYPAFDHNLTDENAPIGSGFDGYTRSKIECERWFLEQCLQGRLNGVALRPGFIYGPGDRTVLPRIMSSLRKGVFCYFDDCQKKLNNTYVGNLVDAVFLAIAADVTGEVFNITDDPVVSKETFIAAIAAEMGIHKNFPTLPRWVGEGLVKAQLLPPAQLKFLGNNLLYSIDRAKDVLKYKPSYNFYGAMKQTMTSIHGEF